VQVQGSLAQTVFGARVYRSEYGLGATGLWLQVSGVNGFLCKWFLV